MNSIVGSIVGINFGQKIIFNIIEQEPEFCNSGYSIVNFLKSDKNKFISDIILSQSYDSIKSIYDDKMIFSEYFSSSNENVENLENILKKQDDFSYIYIYDYNSDLLLVKSPTGSVKALDYKSVQDVMKYSAENKDIQTFIERDF